MTENKKQKSKKDVINQVLDGATWGVVIGLSMFLIPIISSNEGIDKKLGFRISNSLYIASLDGLAAPLGAILMLPFAHLSVILYDLIDKKYTKYEKANKLKTTLQKCGYNDEIFGIPLQEACEKYYDEIVVTLYSQAIIKHKFDKLQLEGDTFVSISHTTDPLAKFGIILYIQKGMLSKEIYLKNVIKVAEVILEKNFEEFYNDLSMFCSKAGICLPEKESGQGLKVKYHK